MLIDRIDSFLSQIDEAGGELEKHKEMVDKMDWWHRMSGRPGDRFDKMRKEIRSMEQKMSGDTYERARFNRLSAMKRQNVRLSKEAEQEYKKLKNKFGRMSEAMVSTNGEMVTFKGEDPVNIPSGRSVIIAKDASGRPKNTVMIHYDSSGNINTEDNKGNKQKFQTVQELVKYLNSKGFVYFDGFNRI